MDFFCKVLEKERPKEDFEVIINGLSNTYSDYVTTFEEYQVNLICLKLSLHISVFTNGFDICYKLLLLLPLYLLCFNVNF